MGTSVAHGESIQVRVVGITDGDTLTALTTEQKQFKVRLAGIDTPERGQPYYKAAKQALSDLAYGKEAVIEYDKEDRWGRIIGKVVVGGQDVCLEMVTQGWAWWFRKYAHEQSATDQNLYESAESASRAAKRGVWVDPDPTPPWEWRKRTQ